MNTEALLATSGTETSPRRLDCVRHSEALVEYLADVAERIGDSTVARSSSERIAPPRAGFLPLSRVVARPMVARRQAAGHRTEKGPSLGDGKTRQDRVQRGAAGSPIVLDELRHGFRGETDGGRMVARSRASSRRQTPVPTLCAEAFIRQRPRGSSAVAASNVDGPTSPFAPVELVTDAQLARYARLIHDKTGIRVSPHKKLLLSNRLRRRLRGTGIRSFDAYYRYLEQLPANHPEWNAFYQEITTHESYLFRDEQQWDWFSRAFLKEHVLATRTSGGPRRLRAWSAACSAGEEAYTIACCVAAGLPNLQAWEVDILGTDIALGEIRRARQPAYGRRAMRLVPKKLGRFFQENADSQTWSPKPVLQRMVRFRQHNLLGALKEQPFDIVFLKNVLIYFDKESKAKVLQNVGPLVRPGGLLVAGAAEGVVSLLGGFRRLEPWLFRRLPPNAS
jgi:chemotaxis protein methyltransferase CheR